MLRVSRILLVTVLALSVGLHWALLQTLAWTSMVVTYTQQKHSLAAAIARTFDGAHPCKLCKLVSEGKKSEQKQDVQKTTQKLDMFAAGEIVFLFPAAPQSEFPAHVDAVRCCLVTPPSPPPRLG